MKTYLVGGAVRNQLLGLPVTERDYVVVGATGQDLLDAGYRTVGRDFPVFLHPETGEEYALARTERKTGPGHQGFTCHASPEVTLEQDLERRDLTINAMAQTPEGDIIDPLGGRRDLSARLLRHVSDAFVEDPLRILRVARFKASLHHLGFDVHPATTGLLQQMVQDGLLGELAPERIQAELNRALATPHPEVFFHYLNAVGAGPALWPEVDDPAIKRLSKLAAPDVEARFSVLLMALDDAQILRLCERLKCGATRTAVTRLIAGRYEQWTRLPDLSPEAVVAFLRDLDAIRRQQRFGEFNRICEAISGLRLQGQWLALLQAAASAKARDLATDATGPALGALLRAEQIRKVASCLTTRRDSE